MAFGFSFGFYVELIKFLKAPTATAHCWKGTAVDLKVHLSSLESKEISDANVCTNFFLTADFTKGRKIPKLI